MNQTSEAGQAIGSPLMQDSRPASVKVEKEHKLRKFALDNFERKPYSDEAAWKNARHTARHSAKKIVKTSLAYAIINMSTGWKDAEKAIIGPVG